MSKEYWFCFIGPIERDEVPWGGDFPLRRGVEERWVQMFNEPAERCASGWGISEEDYKEFMELMNKQSRRRMKRIYGDGESE